jgi:hypothetical protein
MSSSGSSFYRLLLCFRQRTAIAQLLLFPRILPRLVSSFVLRRETPAYARFATQEWLFSAVQAKAQPVRTGNRRMLLPFQTRSPMGHRWHILGSRPGNRQFRRVTLRLGESKIAHDHCDGGPGNARSRLRLLAKHRGHLQRGFSIIRLVDENYSMNDHPSAAGTVRCATAAEIGESSLPASAHDGR